MQRSPLDPASPMASQSLDPSPTKEHILREWESTHEALLQREREMVDMSSSFIQHIKSARAESEALLQANQSMLEESRRRGQQLKKLEAFFASFPLPYSLRQPVSAAFLSVGIQMPWNSTAKPEQRDQQLSFSDTNIHDGEDLCTKLQIMVGIKDQLAQKLLDQQVEHEAEMEAFILHHKNSMAIAHHNSMLATAQWTLDRLTLETRIREKEVRVKKLVQETFLLKQTIEKQRGQTNCSAPSNLLEHLSRKKEVGKIEQLSPLSNGDRAASPTNTRIVPRPQLSFDETPVKTFSNSPSNSIRKNHEQTRVPEQQHQKHPSPRLESSVLALTAKGTKICADFRPTRTWPRSDSVYTAGTSDVIGESSSVPSTSTGLLQGSGEAAAIPNSAPS